MRNTLIVLVALAVVGGAGFGVWQYAQSQYYVGTTDDGYVAVFRGVPGDLVGLHLSSVDVKSNTKAAELTKLARSRVGQGIDSSGRAQALNTLRELTDNSPGNPNKLPICATASPTPTPSKTPKSGSSPRHGASSTPTPRHTPSGTPSAVSPSPTQSASPATRPGDCRPGR